MTNATPAPKKKHRFWTMERKQSAAGWAFLTPATLMIFVFSFYPMVQAFLTSMKRGLPTALTYCDPLWRNYQRMLSDKVFIQSVTNTLTYLIVQVPIMLVLAVIFATLLNNKDLKFRGLFRTCIFLPCATGLVAYSMIFRTLFTYDGMVNALLTNIGILSEPINWLNDPFYAKVVIIVGLVWRWTGYNMIFYLSGMQSIDYSIYEAARIDGANQFRQLINITIPLLKPIILVTAIMSTNGTLQLFDESVNLTRGGPANMTITMSHYIYNTMFTKNPNFGYAAAMSFVILIMVAVLSAIQTKVGDKR
ncbi:MAG: sugar ABC transporter permease [Candidatus Ventricola sp.]|nr:sugar ABC transporter permease [Candidatus Ventricola sp.]MDY4856406.1 sugar ABC transporter permease [Candidatus Ventricola sp.]